MSRWHLLTLVLVPVVLVMLLVRGLVPTNPVPTLRLAAASSLRTGLPDVVAAFTEANPELRVEVTYAASGTLAAAIQRGAPYDLFLCADETRPAHLLELGLLTASGVQPFATSSVVYVSRESDADAQGATPRRIAIPNPAFAPYGRAAQAWLDAHPDFGPALFVHADSVANAAGLFRTGAVDGAFVDAQLAAQLAQTGAQTVTLDDAPRIILAAGVLKSSSRPDHAERFVRFILEDPHLSVP